MIRHQAVAQQADRLPLLGLPKRLDEGGVVAVLVEESGAAHRPVEGVVHVAAGVAARSSRHVATVPASSLCVKEKRLPTPFLLPFLLLFFSVCVSTRPDES